ncbi:GNAT family N-acetyltransferase [Streptomyces sp. MST-110588]|uniref:GNAT family N-acetyltransferase n=1 Tax=Streptomyces sp. MST-110588 TaxID=2833628 RepID=UPI001F5D3AE3|nr:GNAT family N-acetyltransferase [Streptomyces sp. MST-110588]UNO42310.1 GNAT family N-acetyltransferase [Streptomyces sp. MST-110588]
MNNPATTCLSWTVAAEPVGSPEAMALTREYYTEVSDRYFLLHEGRRSTPAELEEGLADYPTPGLVAPDGLLLVARYGDEAVGCAGVRLLDARTAELKQLFLRTAVRGKGGAGVLLAAAERAAAELGAERIRLDTRLDLVEAIALYRAHGFREIPAYNNSPYAQIFFEKRL